MNDKQFVKYLMHKMVSGEVVSLRGQQFVASGPYRVIVDHEGVPVILERHRLQHRLFDTREALVSWALQIMMQFDVTFTMTDADGNESTFQQMGSSLEDDFSMTVLGLSRLLSEAFLLVEACKRRGLSALKGLNR